MTNLNGIDNPDVSKSFKKQSIRRSFRWKPIFARVISTGVIVGIALAIAGFLGLTKFGKTIAMVIGVFLGTLIFGYFDRIVEDKELKQLYFESGHRCTHCGYDMNGLSEDQCPECGTKFEKNN